MDENFQKTVNCVTINCVVLGYDSHVLHVMLTQGEQPGLPSGDLRPFENLDAAAVRVLGKNAKIVKLDLWQSKTMNATQGSRPCVTVTYVALVRMRPRLTNLASACWVPVNEAMQMHLPAEHIATLRQALDSIVQRADEAPALLLELLPSRFTALQLRSLIEQVRGKNIDVRNFNKMMRHMTYVVPLELYEQGVAHRAARYYRFDHIRYKKSRR